MAKTDKKYYPKNHQIGKNELINRGFLYEPWPSHIWHKEGTNMFYKNRTIMFLIDGIENKRKCPNIFYLDHYIKKFT